MYYIKTRTLTCAHARARVQRSPKLNHRHPIAWRAVIPPERVIPPYPQPRMCAKIHLKISAFVRRRKERLSRWVVYQLRCGCAELSPVSFVNNDTVATSISDVIGRAIDGLISNQNVACSRLIWCVRDRMSQSKARSWAPNVICK